MKLNNIFLSFLLIGLAACHSDNAARPEYVEYADTIEYTDVAYPQITDCSDNRAGTVKYSIPRDGDLTLETRHHVIQIQGRPEQQYSYYVWTGDKSYSDDPDMIVEDGNVMVLQEN